jgi:hypothetical protein
MEGENNLNGGHRMIKLILTEKGVVFAPCTGKQSERVE